MENRGQDRIFNELLKIRRELGNSKNQTSKGEIYPLNNDCILTNDRIFRELFFKLFHGSSLLMTITTLNDGMYVEVNNAFLETSGYSREELSGQTITGLNIFNKDEMQRLVVNQNKGLNSNIELKLRTKSGDFKIVNTSVEIIHFNEQACLLSVMRDLTEIQSLQQEMARLGQLNLLGEMAASIGHEIRNPMTTARGFLQMLGGKKECDRYKEYFDLIIEELDRANNIVSEYLSLAQSKSKDLKLQNLNLIIKTLLPLIQADALIRDINIVSQLGDIPDMPLIEKEIRQLILNLIRNGIEATEKGGTITVRTYTENSVVVLAIQDQGEGIKSELVEKLGTPFLTTKENGTGLGLAVCYNIAARHNATITVNTGQTGTTFFVKFNILK